MATLPFIRWFPVAVLKHLRAIVTDDAANPTGP